MRRKDGALKSLGEVSTAGLLRRYSHGKPYLIHKDVALNQVIALERDELSAREFDYYTRSSLDFVICADDSRFTYELAIEFDGKQHAEAEQAWKDEVKNRICSESELPLLRIGDEAVKLRRDASILEFLLDQYFGEKAFSSQRHAGRLGTDDEYFAQFPGTLKAQKRLKERELFPLVAAFEPTFRFYRYQVQVESIDRPAGSGLGFWKATSQVNIYKGGSTDRPVFHVAHCASIQDPNPSQSIEGVHGWHIASELAIYLCFDSIEREWVPK